MINFFEKAIWVITIIVILANMALVVKFTRKPQPWPDSISEGAVKTAKASDLDRDLARIKKDFTAGTARGSNGKDTMSLKRLEKVISKVKHGNKVVKQHNFKVKHELVRHYEDNFAHLYDQIKTSNSRFTKDAAGPYLHVTKVSPNSIVDQIGIKKGDKVRTVNGFEIKDRDNAMELYNKLRTERLFIVEVERGGTTVLLRYEITR